jgi:hypothetical protein
VFKSINTKDRPTQKIHEVAKFDSPLKATEKLDGCMTGSQYKEEWKELEPKAVF